jgi:hypothetical protein
LFQQFASGARPTQPGGEGRRRRGASAEKSIARGKVLSPSSSTRRHGTSGPGRARRRPSQEVGVDSRGQTARPGPTVAGDSGRESPATLFFKALSPRCPSAIRPPADRTWRTGLARPPRWSIIAPLRSCWAVSSLP